MLDSGPPCFSIESAKDGTLLYLPSIHPFVFAFGLSLCPPEQLFLEIWVEASPSFYCPLHMQPEMEKTFHACLLEPGLPNKHVALILIRCLQGRPWPTALAFACQRGSWFCWLVCDLPNEALPFGPQSCLAGSWCASQEKLGRSCGSVGLTDKDLLQDLTPKATFAE